MTAVMLAILCVLGCAGQDVSPGCGETPDLMYSNLTRVSSGSILRLSGENFGSRETPRRPLKAIFRQGSERFVVDVAGAGRGALDETTPRGYFDARVPEALRPGPCSVAVEACGRESTELSLDVVAWEPPALTSLTNA